MYVKVNLGIKTTQKGKIVNRLVKTVVKQFPKESTQEEILHYLSEYHLARHEHVSQCTAVDLGDSSEILWEGKRLQYFVTVNIGGTVLGDGIVRKIVTPLQESRLEEELLKVTYD